MDSSTRLNITLWYIVNYKNGGGILSLTFLNLHGYGNVRNEEEAYDEE